MFYTSLSEFKKANGYDINGIWLPRVTSIVSIKAKPGLTKFLLENTPEAAEAMKTKSAEEGTLLHETIEGIMEGKDVSIPDSLRPAVEKFLEFNTRTKIIPHQVETRVISNKHQYTGTIDVLAEIKGKLGVLDIKSSYAIYRDYNIQAAAYVEALRENPNMPNLTRWILRIDQFKSCLNGCGATMRPKGGMEKVREKYNAATCNHVWGELEGDIELKELKDLEHDVKAFLAAKILWEWENDYWIRKIREASNDQQFLL